MIWPRQEGDVPMKLPFILFAVFALVAAAGGALIPAGRDEEETVGLALLVLGILGATVLPFLTYLVKRDARKQ
jgi:Mn2+/Fe2+ NRAMP family transporter